MSDARVLAPHELRALALAACPELAAAFQLAERVAALNPAAEQLGVGILPLIIGEARAISNGHSPRDALRVSHAELQEQLSFMWAEYGVAMRDRYPGAARYTLEALQRAHTMNPARHENRGT